MYQYLPAMVILYGNAHAISTDLQMNSSLNFQQICLFFTYTIINALIRLARNTNT